MGGASACGSQRRGEGPNLYIGPCPPRHRNYKRSLKGEEDEALGEALKGAEIGL